MGIFKRFRIAVVLRMQRRQAAARGDTDVVQTLTRALDDGLILDEIDEYCSNYFVEFCDEAPDPRGNFLDGLWKFIIEHWDEILLIITQLLLHKSGGRTFDDANRILAEDCELRTKFGIPDDAE